MSKWSSYVQYCLCKKKKKDILIAFFFIAAAMSVHYRYRYPFVTANAENLHTGDARGTPINPYSRLAFAKGLHARLGADADSVLAHLREELLCEQIVSTTVRAVRQDIHGHTYEGEYKDGKSTDKANSQTHTTYVCMLNTPQLV